MKKLLIVLIILLFALPSESKILLITSATGTGIGEGSREISGRFMKCVAVGGVEYDVMISTDTTYTTTSTSGIWYKASSGDYSMAVCLNTPILNASYDSAAELLAGGWPKLHQWVNRADSMAFPIPLFIPLQSSIVNTGVWSDSVTGILETGDYFSTNEMPLVGERGDSVITDGHFAAATTFPTIATNDSLDWCYPLAWADSVAGGYSHAVWCSYWMIKGTGNHSVTYMYAASTSWLAGYFASAIAMFEKYQPIEVPVVAEGFGYYSSVFGGDTTNASVNLLALRDSVTEWGMKFEFLTNTYRWVKGDSLRYAWPWVETYIAANPDNFRMTMYGKSIWTGSHGYWINYYGNDISQATMETNFANGIDSIQSYPGLAAIIDTTIFMGADKSRYDWFNKFDETARAMLKNGVNKLYVYGGATSNIRPAYANRSLHAAQKTRIKYSDGVYYDFYILPWGGSSMETYMDANGISQTTVNERSLFQATVLKYMMGEYAGSNSMSGNEAAIKFATQWGHYQPGIMFEPQYLFGDNNILEALSGLNAQINMINYIVITHGNGVNTELIKYAWMDEVKWDRYNNRLWHNDHVTR